MISLSHIICLLSRLNIDTHTSSSIIPALSFIPVREDKELRATWMFCICADYFSHFLKCFLKADVEYGCAATDHWQLAAASQHFLNIFMVTIVTKWSSTPGFKDIGVPSIGSCIPTWQGTMTILSPHWRLHGSMSLGFSMGWFSSY